MFLSFKIKCRIGSLRNSLNTRRLSTLNSLSLFINKDDKNKQKGDGLIFAGLYILHTRQVKPSDLHQNQRPPILPKDILTNPVKLHNFLINLHLMKSERIFLLPLDERREQSSEQVKDQETSLVIKSSFGSALQLYPEVKTAKLNEYVSNSKLWDTGIHRFHLIVQRIDGRERRPKMQGMSL